MEELIKAIVEHLGPTLSAYLGVGTIALVIIPYAIKAWESWTDARSGVRASSAERARLELMKLWLEIEALKKEHSLEFPFPTQPPIAAMLAPTPKTRVDAALSHSGTPAEESVKRPGVWPWLAACDRQNRVLSHLILGSLILATLLMAVMGLILVITGFVSISKAAEDIAFALIATVIELLLLLLLRVLYRQHKLLRIAHAAILKNAAPVEGVK